MAIYELREAELGGLKGQGYAYPVKTFQGKQYKGVFFTDDPEAASDVADQEEIEFTGTVYERTKVRSDTMNVQVVNSISAGIGERLDFVVNED